MCIVAMCWGWHFCFIGGSGAMLLAHLDHKGKYGVVLLWLEAIFSQICFWCFKVLAVVTIVIVGGFR